jgi:IS30 family transposase
MVHISQRPPEADERRVPGHWEGDLLIGKRNATAIATLVERSSGFAMLVPLPDGYKPRARRPGARAQGTDASRDSAPLADVGPGPRDGDWKQVHVDAGIEVFFCDPHAPWQRGSNENTNGLLRQYLPKGFDFSTVTEAELDAVADELNARPLKRFNFATPTEQLSQWLLQ